MKWINKKDKQPAPGDKVIVWSGDHDIIEAYWYAPSNDFVDTLESQYLYSDYWIPFPEFPFPDEEKNNYDKPYQHNKATKPGA